MEVVVDAVVEVLTKIDHGEAGKVSPGRGFDDSLFHRRNEVLGNGAAENMVHKFKLFSALQRFHLDLAIAVLAVSAALLFVTTLNIGLAANGLTIRNLRRFEVYFRVIALLQLGDDNFNMLLAGSGNKKLLGLRVAEEAN